MTTDILQPIEQGTTLPRRHLRAERAPGPVGHLLVMLVAVVITQRIAVPVGIQPQLPLSLPVVLLVMAHGILTRQLQLDRMRVRLFTVSVGGMVLLTLVALARQGTPSVTSVLFVVAIYCVLTLAPAVLSGPERDRVLDVFVAIMLVGAVLGLLQLVTQYAGLAAEDWLARVVPPRWLLQGYNTGDPIVYGSPVIRANGVLFLEPSFLSYFLGLAVVVAVQRGRGALTISLLLLGIVPTSAINGVVVLVLGILALLAGPRRRNLLALLVPAGAAVVLALATPFGARFFARSGELGQQNTSADLRLVEPYVRFAAIWLDDTGSLLLGHGAGTATVLTGADVTPGGLLTPVVTKVLLEYGLFAGVAFLFFLAWSMLAGGGSRPWTLGLLVSYVVVNAAFLQCTMALATILFVHLLRGPPEQREVGAAGAPGCDPSLTHRGGPIR